MGVLIDIAYLGLIAALSPVLLYRIATREKYRAGFFQRFGAAPRRDGATRCLWVHAVSVGEAKIVGILIPQLEKAFPGWEIVISTTTHTGRQIIEKEHPHKTVFYFPLDFSWVTARCLRRVRPDCLILIELELWPNLLRHAARQGLPVVVVNGRITEKGAVRHRWLARLAPWLFSGESVKLFCTQNETYAERLRALGVPSDCIAVTGMMKHDAMSVEIDAAARGRMRKLLGIGERELVIVGASVYTDEVAALAAAFGELREEFPQARLVLVPRHMERLDDMIAAIEDNHLTSVRRSTLSEDSPADLLNGEVVVLVDTMGELVDICAVASCVFVGKSLFPSAAGGHNMLEPAGLGRAVLFGPHTANFEEEARLLMEGGGAVRVRDGAELKGALADLLTSEEKRDRLGARARELVAENQGATAENIRLLKNILL